MGNKHVHMLRLSVFMNEAILFLRSGFGSVQQRPLVAHGYITTHYF